MEVLRHGNTYREVECKKCCALLSYSTGDIKVRDHSGEVFGGDFHSNIKKYITCPECKEEIVLSWLVDGEEIK